MCAVLPDADVIGFRFGIRYGDFWGHRGFTHSLFFAVLVATVVVLLWFRHGVPGLSRAAAWAFFFLATASHGLLDAMTDGGLGVAFFLHSTTIGIFFPGGQSEYRQLVLDASSQNAVSTFSEVNCFGSVFQPWCWLPQH
jgi:inner membrane protein